MKIHQMEELIFLVEESDDGGYTAKALGHSIFTEGETEAEVRQHVIEAVKCHFDDDEKRMVRLHFVKDEVFSV